MTKAIEDMGKNIDEFLKFAPKVAEHIENDENPHGVSKKQVGLSEVENKKQATKEEFEAFKSRKDNPHSVTKEQVGLSKVKNEEQASLSRYKNHIVGTSDRHTADHIDYDGKLSVKERIEKMVIEDAGGTVYHNELLNRDEKNQHPLSAIENAGEVLLFEGITDDGEEKELFTSSVSEFVTEGAFILPDGYVADVEISVLAAREQEGVIKDRNAVLFKDNYLFAKINVMNWFNTNDKTEIKEAESAWDNDTEGNSNVYSCKVSKFDYDKRTLLVKGAEGHRVYWRGIFRINNIMKVGE